MRKIDIILVFTGLFLLIFSSAYTQHDLPIIDKVDGYFHVPGSIHVHTTMSDGDDSLDKVIEFAKEKGIGVIVITDHDHLEWRYYFNLKYSKMSVFKYGVDRYFHEIRKASERYNRILIIPGMEVGPFYYWRGIFPFITCIDSNKHFLVCGIDSVDVYKSMPLVATGKSKYDQFHGAQGVKPFQDMIDYVVKHNGLIFWAHLEEKRKYKRFLTAKLQFNPHIEDMLNTYNYTGFSAFGWGDTGEIYKAGGYWDKVLCEFCQGKRKRPVWVIGESDYHGARDDRLYTQITIFLLKEFSQEAVINSLRNGKIYACKTENFRDFRLKRFVIRCGTQQGIMGDIISFNKDDNIEIRVKIESSVPIKWIKIIRDGMIIKETCDNSISFVDNDVTRDAMHYYRIYATAKDGSIILSNPIFISFVQK